MHLGKAVFAAACLATLGLAFPPGKAAAQEACACPPPSQESEWVVEVWFATGIAARQTHRVWAFTAREAEVVGERLLRNSHPRRDGPVNALARRE